MKLSGLSRTFFPACLVFLFVSTAAVADESTPVEMVSSFAVPANGGYNLRHLARTFDFEGKDNGDSIVYVKESERAAFLAAVPNARLLQKDISDIRGSVGGSVRVEDLYNFARVEQDLRSLSQAHPTFTALETYGRSTSGRNLYAFRMGRGTGRPLMITGATHGNEVLTVEVVMEIVKRWTTAYGTNARITDILDRQQIYFIPVVSPDSYVARARYVDGVDPNRNYPWPGNPNRQSVGVIKAMIDFATAKNIQGSVDIHSVAGVIMYPWAYTDSPPAANVRTRFETIVSDMAQVNGYQTGQISDVMYIAQGSSADYFLWRIGTIAIAIELSQGFARDFLHLKGIADEIEEPLARFASHFLPN